MKQFILSISFLFISIISLHAQIQLIGAANGYRPGKIDIVEWQIFDSATVQVFPSELKAYLVAKNLGKGDQVASAFFNHIHVDRKGFANDDDRLQRVCFGAQCAALYGCKF